MSKRLACRIAAVACGLWLVAALAGCDALSRFSKPSARITGVGLKDISLDALTLMFDVEVSNPYSAPLPLVNLDYALASAGSPFLSGQADIQGTVPAKGAKTLALPARVNYLELFKAVKGVRPGDVIPYAAELGLSVKPPAVGALRLPMKKEGKLPVPTVPDVDVKDIKWQGLSLDQAGGVLRLGVVNRNKFPVDLAKINYGLSLGGVEVATSSLAKPVAFGADGGAGELEVPLSFSPQKLGLSAYRMLTGGGAGYKLNGSMDLGTPFGPMSLPFDKIGNTVFRR